MKEKQDIFIQFRDYLNVIQKFRWTVISALFIVVFSVAIIDFTAQSIYQATAKMIIEKDNPNIVSIQEVMSIDASGTDYYQTQYKIIESRTVAREVIKRLQLDQSKEFFPEPADHFLANLLRPMAEKIKSWRIALKDLMNKGKDIPETNQTIDAELVDDFIEQISVEPIRNSRLVDINFEAKDPALAAEIANTISEAFIDHSLTTRLHAIKDALDWLNERITKERVRVEDAEKKLQAYREKHNIITEFSGEVETVTAQKLAELNTQVVDAESARVEAETKYKQALRLQDNPLISASIPEVIDNPLIQQIKKAEVDLYTKISELSEKYGSQHPKMLAAETELVTLQKRRINEVRRIIDSLNNAYEVTLAREKSLKEALANQKNEALSLNKKAIEYGVLKREAEGAREMYEVLIKRFKETSVTEDITTSNIRIIDQAEVPKDPIKPKKMRDLLLATVLGMMLGIGLAFFFDHLDNTVKNPDELEQRFNIPCLGMIPVFQNKDKSDDGMGVPELVTTQLTKSTISEAYRSIRTKILFSSAELVPKVIMFTSSMAQEGKTTTSANLAVTMAQAGSKVLLIDCDLRRPRVHHILGLHRDTGITNVLVGNCDLTDVIMETSIPNLYAIACGPIPPNPSELLGAKQMGKTLNVLKEKFDRIIIDTPPISAVTDAVVMAKYVEGVVIVVRAHQTKYELIQNALKNLTSINATILGAVLNDVDMEKNAYYYQNYYYQDYYEEDAEDIQHKETKYTI